ncbi:efflux transporter periplasmic adaptor subunit [Candidatus Entotheonella serta]|nr:efflux transporter periplasmic adaptor subunit [Candidatus Entotheonella serta]
MVDLFGILIALAACGQQPSQSHAAVPPPEVMVAVPYLEKIIEWDEYTGRFQAVERVEVHARVSGYLEAIHFKDGQMVEKGELLFTIDQRPFKIALEQAKASLKQMRAEREQASNDFKRAHPLLNSHATSAEEFDRRRLTLEAAQARVEAVQAEVPRAKLDLEFTEIKSPISGRVSRDLANIGNLISGGATQPTLLTTVVSQDPIHFYFEASEKEFLKYIRLDRDGSRPGSDTTPNPIYVKLQDESDYRLKGQMDFVDNEVDRGTGTVSGRAIFPNPEKIIYPGLFGRVHLLGSGEYEALMVPDDAIGTDQSRKFVYVVKIDNAVVRRWVTLGPLHEGLRVIRDGLSASDRVVIGGVQRVRPGVPVLPKEGAISKPSDGEKVS